MPNIGFFELLLIGVVALLVLGPEKLPGAIRTTSLWIGRARRSFNKVRSEIERELNADEIRRQLHNESILADLDEAKKKAKALTDQTNKELQAIGKDVDETVKRLSDVKDPALLDEVDSPADNSAAETLEANNNADSENALSDTQSTQEPEDDAVLTKASKKSAPVKDFYNNPDVGVIQLRDGVFQAADDEQESTDKPNQKTSDKKTSDQGASGKS